MLVSIINCFNEATVASDMFDLLPLRQCNVARTSCYTPNPLLYPFLRFFHKKKHTFFWRWFIFNLIFVVIVFSLSFYKRLKSNQTKSWSVLNDKLTIMEKINKSHGAPGFGTTSHRVKRLIIRRVLRVCSILLRPARVPPCRLQIDGWWKEDCRHMSATTVCRWSRGLGLQGLR